MTALGLGWFRLLGVRHLPAPAWAISHMIFSLCPFRAAPSLSHSASHGKTNTAKTAERPGQERLLEYVALLPGELRRSGWMAAEGGRVVAHVPLVVYNGRAEWNVPLRLDERGWAPSELRTLQPRLFYRLIDAKDYAGDDAADGNLARAVLALDAAPAQGLAPALERAMALLSATDDEELWRSFVAWCGGTLSPRLGGRLPTLMDDKETTMLAETLREWDEQKIAEGRREGRREGMRAGRREGQRVLLCSQASQRFGAAAGAELEAVLAGVEDASELARVGALIIDCDSGQDFLARARLR